MLRPLGKLGILRGWLTRVWTGRSHYSSPSDPGARLDHPIFGDNDDTIANVVAFSVKVPMAFLIYQLRAVADASVLVDDDPVEDDIASDAETGIGVSLAHGPYRKSRRQAAPSV
jgi:hypothetical protein